jgi:hypothetical protein
MTHAMTQAVKNDSLDAERCWGIERKRALIDREGK